MAKREYSFWNNVGASTLAYVVAGIATSVISFIMYAVIVGSMFSDKTIVDDKTILHIAI